MQNFAEYLSSLPHTPLTEAVSSLYEAVYLPNGQPERLESTRYILVCRDIGLNRNERMNQIYDNALAECDHLNRMRSDEFLAESGKSASEVRSPMTREEALDYLNCIKRGASDCKILKSTPSMLAYVPRKNKYGDLPMCVKLCMIKPVQFSGLTSETDPEWSIDPNKRADNRYRRWKRAELGLPYAKDFKNMREKKPNDYQFNSSKHGDDFGNYVNFAVNAATSDTIMFPDRPNEIEQWVDEKRKNGQPTDVNTYENNLYESVHTSRAKKVNGYTKKLLQLVWQYFDNLDDAEIDSKLCFYPFDVPVTVALDFHKPELDPPSVYFPREQEMIFSVGGFLLAMSHYEANSLKQSQIDAMNVLANKKLANNTSETIKLSATEIDMIRFVLHTDIFMQLVRHEITHMVQDIDSGYTERFDEKKQLAKLGLSSENPEQYHDVYPWEIDAGVHQRVVEIINHIGYYKHPMGVANIVYKQLMKECKELGINDPDLTKQCWETAASLTRAVALAKKEGKQVNAEAILDHIDDYAA